MRLASVGLRSPSQQRQSLRHQSGAKTTSLPPISFLPLVALSLARLPLMPAGLRHRQPLPMRATLDIPPPTHREVTPVSTCHRCGCYLRSFHDGDYCEPCGVPKAERVEEAEEFDLIAAVAGITDQRQRLRGFEALSELMQEQGIAA